MASLELEWVVAYSGLAILLIVAGVTDALRGKIYNALTYPAVALGLIEHTLFGGLRGEGAHLGLSGSAVGLAVGFLPMLMLWLAGGVGDGDAKLMAGVGALGGWGIALATMFYGLIAALLMAIVVMIRHRVVRRTLGRIWRFVWLSLAMRKSPLPTTADSPKVPLGLAFSIGAAVAMVEALAGRPGGLLSF
jgi:prepilin peptidase CpaA